MSLLTRKITCPYCFESFDTREVKFRCMNPRCSKMEEDRIYAQARNQSIPSIMGHVFEEHEYSWKTNIWKPNLSARCDVCSKESIKRICPYCHFEISHDAGLIDDHVIAIIGGPNTGKGHYIATLIQNLQNEIARHFNFSLRKLGDETRFRYENDYFAPIYRRKVVIDGTRSALIDNTVKQPMVFRLTIQDGRKKRAVNISFFDSAGEDMKSLDTMSTEARYIYFASGIIFLLDPLQIEAIRLKVPQQNLPKKETLAEPFYIVERLKELFDNQAPQSTTKTVKTPIAFVFSKIDTLFPIIDPSSAMRLTGEHFGYFNLIDAQSVHTEIENYLQYWMGSGFCNMVRTNFSNFHYFGVSSLGRSPDSNGNLETISPIRIEDPFLWILHKLGFIKGRRGKLK
jgi:hypothetical protein